MKPSNNKAVVAVTGIAIAAVASLLFLVLDATPLFITAYIFVLIGIALLCYGILYLFNNTKSYPWAAALPMTCWRYLITQLTVSAVFVIAEQMFSRSFPTAWFVIIHVALLAFFVILLMLQKGGKEIIEKRDAEVKEKVSALRLMIADVESAMRSFPQYEKDLKAVYEALRYSDPMSHPAVAPYEEQIQRSLMELPNNPDGIPERCAGLLRQIADRNSRVKALK